MENITPLQKDVETNSPACAGGCAQGGSLPERCAHPRLPAQPHSCSLAGAPTHQHAFMSDRLHPKDASWAEWRCALTQCSYLQVDLRSCQTTGAGLSSAVAGEAASLRIAAHDSQGNPITTGGATFTVKVSNGGMRRSTCWHLAAQSKHCTHLKG